MNKKKENVNILLKDLNILKKFFIDKKITLRMVAHEMDYSYVYVTRVFTGFYEPSSKFMKACLRAVLDILRRDVNDFQILIESRNLQKFL